MENPSPGYYHCMNRVCDNLSRKTVFTCRTAAEAKVAAELLTSATQPKGTEDDRTVLLDACRAAALALVRTPEIPGCECTACRTRASLLAAIAKAEAP